MEKDKAIYMLYRALRHYQSCPDTAEYWKNVLDSKDIDYVVSGELHIVNPDSTTFVKFHIEVVEE